MISRFEYEGEWWFPEQPVNKYRGRLKFSPAEGISLNLLVFQANVENIPDEKIDLILGSSADGRKITLYKCFLETKSSTWSNNGINVVSFFFISRYVFIGTHFTAVQNIQFKKISVHFLHLEEWVATSGFIMKLQKKGMTVKYKAPKSVSFNVSKDLQIRISFSVSYPTFSKPQVEASIKQTTWLVFSLSVPKTLDDFLKDIYIMQNFLTLAMSEPTYPTIIEGESESEKIKVNDGEICRPIEIIFEQLPYILKPTSSLHSRDMLFTFKDISKKKDAVKNWFEKADLLEPVCNLYFGTLYQKGIYSNNELLNLTQALEAYHRKTMRNIELPPKKHESRVKKILNKTPAEHKDWLKSKLKYSNEPTLRKRLRDIWANLPAAITTKLGNRDTFIGITVDTRNYWTHFDDELKAKVAKGYEFYRLVTKLRIMLQTCLLKELELTQEEIASIMIKLISRNNVMNSQ